MAVLSLRMRSELVLSWVNDSRGRVMHKEIGSKMIVRFKRFVTVLAVIGCKLDCPEIYRRADIYK